MRFALAAAALALIPSALGAITITTPSPSSYWVQNTTNYIQWQYASGDPSPVDIIITNGNSSFLNGEFSIAQFVDLSQKSVTVTNVTLKVGTGYVASFTNPQNHSQIYATSQQFDVRTPGTTPAQVSSVASTPSGTASGSGSSPSATSPANSTRSVAPNPTESPNNSNGAQGTVAGVFGILAACGIASLSSLVL